MKTKNIFGMAASLLAGLILVPAASAVPVQWSGNGHFYDFIPGNVTWFNATGFSFSIMVGNERGHLATITSAAENEFIRTTFGNDATPRFAWIAGALVNSNAWVWKAGPEFNVQFSTGATPTAPFNYANWGGTQPDGALPFQFTAINLGSASGGIAQGQWADFASTFANPTPGVVGYIVEIVPEPSSLALLCFGGLGLHFVTRRRRIGVVDPPKGVPRRCILFHSSLRS